MRQMIITAIIGFFLSVFVGVIAALASGVFSFGLILLRGLMSAGVMCGLFLIVKRVIKLFLPELLSDGVAEPQEAKKKESALGAGLFHRKEKKDADVGNNVNMVFNDSLTGLDAKSLGAGTSEGSYQDKNAKATEVFRSQDPAILAQMVRKSMSNDDDED
jgi:hypothetical protein